MVSELHLSFEQNILDGLILIVVEYGLGGRI